MGVLMLFVLKEPSWFGPSPNVFGTLGTLLIKAPLSQNRNKSAPYGPPFQFIYMRLELWAHHTGYNSGVIGNVLGNNLGTCGTFWGINENLMRTWWEHIGNKKKQKNSRVVILFVFQDLAIILSYPIKLPSEWMRKMIWN